MTRQRAGELAGCLQALAAHSPADDSWRLVVVDDGSTDGTAEVLACLEGDVVVVRHEQPLGDRAALDAALARCGAEVVVVLDPAVRVHDGWMEPLVAAACAPGVAAAQPRLLGTEPVAGPVADGLRTIEAVSTSCLALAPGGAGAVAAAFDLPAGAARSEAASRALAGGGRLVEALGSAAVDTSTPTSGSALAIEVNGLTFDDLAGRAVAAEARGDDEWALALTEAAAHFAWCSHTGRFASPTLERVATEVGRRLGPVAPSPGAGDDGPEVILHVLSEAAQIGGHTRLAWRWMQRDHHRRHVVALTHQGGAPVPAPLAQVADVHVLDRHHPGLVERAAALRSLAAGADVTVLHTHPYDAVAVAGLSFARSPSVLLNHAGHVFWLGTSVADVVACLRPATADLARRRRGIGAERIVALPSPVDPAPDRPARDEARRRLDLPADALVLLTVASPYKYAAADGPGFLDLVTPFLLDHPDAVLVAVGPGNRREWAAAAAATGGRVRAVGRQQDLGPYHAAADIYLDSYPLASTTAVLEAVSGAALPAVAYRPAGPGDPLGLDDFALDGDTLLALDTPEAYRQALAYLAADPGERARRGTAAAGAVAACHGSEGWTARVEALYARAWLVAPAGPPAASAVDDVRVDDLDRRLQALHERGGVARPAEALLRHHLANLVEIVP